MDLFIVEQMLPLMDGVFAVIRKKIMDKAEGNVVHVENIPGSATLAYASMAIMEEYIEKHSRKIRKY